MIPLVHMGDLDLKEWLQTHTGVTPELQSKLLATVLTIVILWAIRLAILRVVQARVPSDRNSPPGWSPMLAKAPDK